MLFRSDPDRGSGPGSRGDLAVLKGGIVRTQMVAHNASSVLDLGCGDIEILQGIEIPRYRGVDLSEVVVDRNRRLRPEWHFEAGEIGTLALGDENWDMTLCLDVLIHQKRREDYEALLSKIAEADSKVIIVSGYEVPPAGWNVFFHEPLSVSLRRVLPARSFRHAARYRDTELFLAGPPA